MPPSKIPALSESLLDLLWLQWRELGAPAARRTARQTRSIIDPEALVLCSLAMLDREPRLGDVLVSWCGSNSRFLSVQRLKNLAPAYPVHAQTHIPTLAQTMVGSGKDLRWRALAKRNNPDRPVLTQRIRKQSVPPPLYRGSVLLLRMRAIFGLGLRADIIAFLLRKRDPHEYADATEIARALGYNRTAIKRSLNALAEAGAVNATGGQDAGYAIGWTSIYEKLAKEIDQIPHWRFAHQTFLWAIALLEAGDNLLAGSEFLRELAMGRLVGEHRQFLTSDSGLFDHSALRAATAAPVIAATADWLRNF